MEYLLGNFVNIPSRNGEIHIKIPLESKIVQSAAKDDLDALYINMCQATYIRQILTVLDHVQPPTPIQVNNSTQLT